MIDKIKTFLKAKASFPFTNNAKSIYDFVKIKNTLYIDIKKINSDENLAQLISVKIINTCKTYSIKFDFYRRQNEQNHLWKSLINQKKWYIEKTEINNEEEDFLVSREVYVKKSNALNNSITTEMVLVKISDTQQYLFEMFNRKKYAFYYFLLITQLENLIKSYMQQKEINNLIITKELNENRLDEAEQKVSAAQKAMKRKIYELHNLVETSTEIYSILDFKQLINSALLTIIGQIGFQQAFMVMYDNETQVFNNIFQKGFGNTNLTDMEFEVSSPLISFFLKNRTPMYLSRIERNGDLKYYVDKLRSKGIFILAPLIYSERLQGIVCVGEKLHFRNFTESDFEIFHILVNIISISIGNSNLFQEMKNLSLTDGMTNLHNYRYFEGRLNEEINRAKRYGKKVSLMILDIDYFKNYNDTLGHQAGDTVLRTMGKLLKNIIRDEDIVARYGGEEFCIILPGIQKEGISSLGERVRIKVESEHFYKEEVQPGGKVTISLGISTFPDDAQDFTELVEKADKALYQAKNLGRNQIRVFQEILQ